VLICDRDCVVLPLFQCLADTTHRLKLFFGSPLAIRQNYNKMHSVHAVSVTNIQRKPFIDWTQEIQQ